jgi:hypothetical protein
VPWNPWRELRRRTHIVFRLAVLPDATGGGVYWARGGRAAIIIDPRLRQVERNAVLAHELVHDERGGGAADPCMPASWGPVVARDEAAVDQEVARRLVPPEELAKFCEVLALLDVGVTAREVAEHFDVPESVAGDALRMMPRHRR